MTDPLRVGDLLYGFCGGYFGRDSYGNKRVEAIGSDWVVVRHVEVSTYTPACEIYVGPPENLCQYRTPEHDPV